MEKNLGQRLRRLILVSTVQIFIAFLLLEGFCRLFDPLGISYMPETSRFLDTMIREQPIGYRLQPGLSGHFNGARYEVNALGLRGPEVAVPKPAGEKRVLFVGDSVVFGVGVNNDETIPAIVESLADQRSSNPDQLRVLNMGVPSYNTEQELIQFETLGQSLQPDAAVLLFSPNDIEPKNWAFSGKDSWVFSFIQRSYALSLTMIAVYRVRELTRSSPAVSSTATMSKEDPRWLSVAAALRGLKEQCDQRSIPFVVIYLGTPDQFPYNLLESTGKELGIEVVGISASSDPRWPDADSPKYRNSVIDSHPNAAGCEMWGRLIYENLAIRGFFGGRTQ